MKAHRAVHRAMKMDHLTEMLHDKKVREFSLTSKSSHKTGLGIRSERDHNSNEKLLKAMNRLDKQYHETLGQR